MGVSGNGSADRAGVRRASRAFERAKPSGRNRELVFGERPQGRCRLWNRFLHLRTSIRQSCCRMSSNASHTPYANRCVCVVVRDRLRSQQRRSCPRRSFMWRRSVDAHDLRIVETSLLHWPGWANVATRRLPHAASSTREHSIHPKIQSHAPSYRGAIRRSPDSAAQQRRTNHGANAINNSLKQYRAGGKAAM